MSITCDSEARDGLGPSPSLTPSFASSLPPSSAGEGRGAASAIVGCMPVLVLTAGFQSVPISSPLPGPCHPLPRTPYVS